MSKKTGFIQSVFPRVSRKIRRKWEDIKYKSKNPVKFSRNRLKNRQLLINIPTLEKRGNQFDAVNFILPFARRSPKDSQKMIDEKIVLDIFGEQNYEQKKLFATEMNHFEENLYKYLQLLKQQENIHKKWDEIYFLLTRSFSLDQKKTILDKFIKFLKKYITEYLNMHVARTSQINNYVEDIIDKIIYLEFFKYYMPDISEQDLKILLDYLQERKKSLIMEFQVVSVDYKVLEPKFSFNRLPFESVNNNRIPKKLRKRRTKRASRRKRTRNTTNEDLVGFDFKF